MNNNEGQTYNRFATMLERYKPLLWAMCYRYSHGDRDLCSDLVQETAILLWRHYSKLPEGAEPRQEMAWVWWEARSLLSNSLRRRRAQRLPTDYNVADAETAERHRQHEMVDDMTALLNEREQTVVQRWREGYTYSEIGREMGISESAARQTMHRAIKKMREKNKR